MAAIFVTTQASVPTRIDATLKLIAEGFTSPVVLTSLDDGSGRLLIADQIGTIHVLNRDGRLSPELFLDLRGRITKLRQGFDERGIVGFALHPAFKTNRKFYVFYSAPRQAGAPEGWDHTSHVSEFQTVPGNPAKADPSSERLLLQIDKPQDNHNCGRLAFGPDGHLYIGTGDGGAANDTGLGHPAEGNGQNRSTLLGKILRIDVNHGAPYAIPSDNPFADGKQGRPEIFAYGVRNPWGLSFDRGGNRELFAVDVGQNSFEEVNVIVRGGNYGWRLREGLRGFDPQKPNQEKPDAPKVGALGEPLRDPRMLYKNLNAFRNDPQAYGISVTGGYVYRGTALPRLRGHYLFADWSRNWAVAQGCLLIGNRPTNPDQELWDVQPLELNGHPGGIVPAYIVAIGEDADGELYYMTNGSNTLGGKTGKVFKLVPL